jgi:hypothetical protein
MWKKSNRPSVKEMNMTFLKLKVPDFISEDFQRKSVALMFACMIWYYVHQHLSEVETFKNIKVEVHTVKSDQVIVSDFLPETSLELRGPRELLNKIDSSKDIQVSVTLDSDLRPGINELRIQESDITLPANLKIESILINTVAVDIDLLVEKEVDVKLHYNNRLSARYSLLREPHPKPERVQIKGPSRQLKKISFLDTEPVYIDPGRTTDFRVTAKLNIPDDVSSSYTNVTAYVELKKRLNFKSLPVQKIYILNTSGQKTSNRSAGEAFAYISGPPEILEQLDHKSDIRLFIELDEKRKGEYPVQFWSRDPNIRKVNITPANIKFEP